MNPESFTPLDPKKIISGTNETSANSNHNLDKDTFVLNDVTYVIDDGYPIKCQIYLMPQHIKRMQIHDQSLAIIIQKLRKDKVCPTALLNTCFLDDDSVLYWSVREGVHICKAMVVPKTLQQLVLTMMHDILGHNGTMRLYNYIRQLYFWQELKQDCVNHLHKCKYCQQISLKTQHYVDSKLRVPNVPMAYIAMDLLGKYSKTSQGHHYALTIICVLTSFVKVITIEDKKAEMVIKAGLIYMYTDKGRSKFILTDRGGKFSM